MSTGSRIEQKRNAKIDSLKKRLGECIEEKDFYYAHQLYKTIYSRYKSLDKVGEYRAILLEGALLMLEHNEINSGSDLALLLVDDYISKHVEPTEENIAPLLKIFAAYKKDLHPRKFIFMRKCIEWSSREDNNNQGHPLLHNTFAKYFASLEEYESAQNHFIRGSDPEAYAEILIEWAKTGYPSEFDLYIARAVLMYLCLSNLKDANIVFEKYVQLQDKEIDTPLLHFIMFLLLALERDALPLFDLLRQKYKKSISRDPSFDQYLDHISSIFFGTNKTKDGLGGLFGNMLRGFMDS